MARELFIFLYLLYIRVLFTIFKFMWLKKKTILVSSFGDNIFYVWKEVLEKSDHEVVILQLSGTQGDYQESERTKVIQFSLSPSSLSFIKGIYHLATSRVVFVDNYFGILSATQFKKTVQCIQLWHANGAVKRFGLKDPSIHFRSNKAFKRFNRVYERFDQVVVGSDKMSSIFQQAFGIPANRILKTGIPRTDLFFDEREKNKVIKDVFSRYPAIKNKKVILYAPTYREQQLKKHSIKLDIKKLHAELNAEYIFLLRLHPAVQKKYSDHYMNFIINVSDYPDLNHLLLVTDILVTDYSSIPFEFSLLEKPMIFYPYDLNEYTTERGFWEEYEQLVPGPIAKNTEDIISLVKNKTFDQNQIKSFAAKWNKYNNGHASEQLIQYVYSNKKKR